LFLNDENQQYALQNGPLLNQIQFQFPFLEVNRAHDWREFTARSRALPGRAEFRLRGCGRKTSVITPPAGCDSQEVAPAIAADGRRCEWE